MASLKSTTGSLLGSIGSIGTAITDVMDLTSDLVAVGRDSARNWRIERQQTANIRLSIALASAKVEGNEEMSRLYDKQTKLTSRKDWNELEKFINGWDNVTEKLISGKEPETETTK